MSQKTTIRTFFNEHRISKPWRPAAQQMRKDFGKLLQIANNVFEGPACEIDVFDSLEVRNGVTLPAIRLSYPNGAKIEFFDSLKIYSVSVTSPEKDVPDCLIRLAYRPDIDWNTLYKPGMPEQMCYPSKNQSPRQFTFKANDHEPADLQKMVLQFSWLQKQAMGLTQKKAEPLVEVCPDRLEEPAAPRTAQKQPAPQPALVA